MAYIGHSPSTGEDNNFKILDTISSYTLTFDGSSSSVVSASDDTIYSYNHRFITGQRVTYNKGVGGTVIAGLADGVYFIIKQDQNNIKLATSADNAVSGTAVNLTGVGVGSSHTLIVAFDGVNTKFKATHTSGKKAKITRASQLVLSVNGVIQQPHDSSSPSTGFGIESGSIVFSQAPQSTDVFWGHILTSNNVTFDISDNKVDHFSGDGSTTTFTLSKIPANNENVLVTIDGVVQYPNDASNVRSYNVVLNVITFATAPGSGTQIEVRHIGFAGATNGAVTGFYGRTGNAVLKSTDNITVNDAAVTGNISAVDATFSGNLTVNGTTTTLDTQLVDVDKIEVTTESTNVAVAVTHNGTGDLIRLYNGSTQVVTVDDEGNVGIGTDNPSAELDIEGATARIHLHDYDSNQAQILQSGNALYLNVDSEGNGTGSFRMRMGGNTSDSEILRITSGGKIGINKSDPDALLHIHNSGTSVLPLKVYRNDVGDVPLVHFQAYNNTIGVVDKFVVTSRGRVGVNTDNPQREIHVKPSDNNPATAVPGYIRIEGQGANQEGVLELYHTRANGSDKWPVSVSTDDAAITFNVANAANGTPDEKLRIASDGNVGIGTDNPSYRLQVQSNGTSTTAAGNIVARFQSFGSGRDATIQLSDNVAHSATISMLSSALIFKQAGAETLRITSSGNVGIGVTNPDTLLHLQSNNPVIRITDANQAADNKTWNISGGNTQILRIQALNNAGGGGGRLFDFYRSGSNVEEFRGMKSGTAWFVVNNNDENVGIGTSIPAEEFHLYGNSAVVALVESVGTNDSRVRIKAPSDRISYLEFADDDADAGEIRYDHTNNYMGFHVNNNEERLRITSDGKVKINVPDSKVGITTGVLDVWGDATSYPIIRLGSLAHNEEGELIRFGRTDISTDIRYHSIFGRHSSTTGNNYLAFKLHNGSGSPFTGQSEVLRLQGDGRVGINSTAPNTPLDVFKVNGTIAQFGDSRTSSFECIRIKNNVASYPAIVNDSSGDTLDLRSLGSTQVTIDANNNSTGKYFRVMANGEGGNGTEIFRAQEDGNIGINESNPTSKLVVDGQVVVNNSNFIVDKHHIDGSDDWAGASHQLHHKRTFTNNTWTNYFKLYRSTITANNNYVGVYGAMLHIVYINDRSNSVQTTGYDVFPFVVRARSSATLSGTFGSALVDLENVIGSSIEVRFDSATANQINIQIKVNNTDNGGSEQLVHAWIDGGGVASSSSLFLYPSILT